MCFALLQEAANFESNITVWSRQSWNSWVYIKDYCENMTRHEIWIPKRFVSAIWKLKAHLEEQTRRLCHSFFGSLTHLQNACASHPSLETITSSEQHSMVYILSSFCFSCSILFQSWKRRNIMPALRTIKIWARDVILHTTTKEHHSTWFSPSSPGPTPFRRYSRKYFVFLPSFTKSNQFIPQTVST